MGNVQIGAAVSLTPTANANGPALLSRFEDSSGNLWVRCQAAAAIAAGEWVGIDELGQASLLTKALADAGYKVGAAQVAFASADYGWVLCRGVGIGKGLVSCAADVALYTTATAGALDDTTTSQTEIKGVRLTAAVGGGGAANAAIFAPVEMHV